MAEKIRKIGIKDADEFMKRDPYEVYEEILIRFEPTLCRCGLASIVGAKEGIVWHKITKQAAAEYERRRPGHQWMSRC